MPLKAAISGSLGSKKAFEVPLPVFSQTSYPYSWVKLNATIDRLTLRIERHYGEDRMLIRRVFLECDCPYAGLASAGPVSYTVLTPKGRSR